jgi:GDPmannose 4,6-dehydratase
MPRALITGAAGQDGTYLAELLLANGYEVYGTIREATLTDWESRGGRRPAIVPAELRVHGINLSCYNSVRDVISAVAPHELYHLAGHRFATYTLDDERATIDINLRGAHHIFGATKECAPTCKVLFAASSEMFGGTVEVPQRETTPFRPRSTYGIAKAAAFELARYYREKRGLFCASGILYNHESPRRPAHFVTRKITRAVAQIKTGNESQLALGNLDARRDWGHAKDSVRAMWLMLSAARAEDFVIATGQLHTVREFCEIAFAAAGLDYRDHVVIDERLLRPDEPNVLVGDASRARAALGWEPQYPFASIVREMVEADLAAAAAVRPAEQ